MNCMVNICHRSQEYDSSTSLSTTPHTLYYYHLQMCKHQLLLRVPHLGKACAFSQYCLVLKWIALLPIWTVASLTIEYSANWSQLQTYIWDSQGLDLLQLLVILTAFKRSALALYSTLFWKIRVRSIYNHILEYSGSIQIVELLKNIYTNCFSAIVLHQS